MLNFNQVVGIITVIKKITIMKEYIPYAIINMANKIFGLALYNKITKSKVVMDNNEIRESIIKQDIIIDGVTIDNNNQVVFSSKIHQLPDFNKQDNKLQFIRDNDLLQYAENEVATYKYRKQYRMILDWLDHGSHNTLALYGLRRTGKTVLILQVAAWAIKNGKHVSYIEFRRDNTNIDIVDQLRTESKQNVDILILDEITYIKDFEQWANILTDIIASNIKVIITGTQSLSIFIAKNSTMFDRVDTIDTTYTSFKEFSRITGTNNILDYIRYGGILSYTKRDLDIHAYIKSAIVDNIEASLMNTSNELYWPNVYSAITSNRLDSYIQLLIMNCNIQLVLKIIRSKYDFKDSNLRSTNQLLKNNITTLSKNIETIEQLEKIELNIADLKAIDNSINDEVLREIVMLLKNLQFISYGELRVIDSVGNKNTTNELLFIQPGIRYNQIIALLDILIQELSTEYTIIKSKLTEDIEGRLLEEVIQLTFMELYKDKVKVFKYKEFAGSKEIDLVIQDKESHNTVLIEIKRSNTVIPEYQAKWLVDTQLNSNIEQSYGKIINRYVLYLGNDTNIEYKSYNIEIYQTFIK